VELGFGGEVPGFYHQFRHGYPAAVIDAVLDAFGLNARDVVVDLGCGTGQLTLPIAGRVRAVIGMDPERDMLARARQAAGDAGVTNVTWLLGADADLPALGTLLGEASIGAVTIGQALHWMNEDLFPAVVPLLRAGGGIAVVTNGSPIWLQETPWSRALRGHLERWLGTDLSASCGTDEQSQQQYRARLAAAGLDVLRTELDYDVELNLDQIVGGLYSALPAALLPAPDHRPAFRQQIRAALRPHEKVSEHVRVTVLAGRLPASP
jgi:SAM-dependent methyltransferase